MTPAEMAVHVINALVPEFPQHAVLHDAMADEARHFEWEYAEGEELATEWQPALDVGDRDVLDIGSGSGAKALLYARLGARRVVGLEIEQHNVARAASRRCALAASDPALRRVEFVAGDATRMPLPSAAFDTVVSIQVFEHIRPVGAALAEVARVLRVGGRAYLLFPPYWSAWGPHLDRWIRFPWPHLLFSDATLIAAVNRIEARKRVNDHSPDFVRLDLRGQAELPHVNKLSMAEFDGYVAALPLRVVGLRLLPVGYRFLPRTASRLGPLGIAPRTADAALHRLAETATGREVIATKAVVVLERVAEGGT